MRRDGSRGSGSGGSSGLTSVPRNRFGLAGNRIGQRNFDTLLIRIPFELTYNQMLASPDGSMYFNLVFCPWKNADTTTNLSATPMELGYNRLYSADISHMQALFQKFRLGWVHLDLDRPKICASAGDVGTRVPQGANLVQPTAHLGTQVIHSELLVKPDGTVDKVQVNGDIQYTLKDTAPSSWREAVDNQSARFQLHKDRKNVSCGWRATTEYEKKWKDTHFSDQELITGGMHIRIKSNEPIPEIPSFAYAPMQVILQGTATYQMQFKDRT